MKKYFVVSDIHSFFTPFMNALNEAQFDINNSEHILIVCGDLFDRGKESVKLYKFIKSLPKDRRILIRGNHEYLLKDLVSKKVPESHDFSNGTVQTIMDFTGYSSLDLHNDWWVYDAWPSMCEDFKNYTYIIDWIFNSDEWVNYFELGQYIFVHSFIPLKDTSVLGGSLIYSYHPQVEFIQDWRNSCSALEWEESTWGCPWQLYKMGLFQKEEDKGKILVCGHWHASDFHREFDEDYSDNYNIYTGKNLIALDGCTVVTNHVNVLVISEEDLING